MPPPLISMSKVVHTLRYQIFSQTIFNFFLMKILDVINNQVTDKVPRFILRVKYKQMFCF